LSLNNANEETHALVFTHRSLREKYLVFVTIIAWKNNYGYHFYSHYFYNVSNNNYINNSAKNIYD